MNETLARGADQERQIEAAPSVETRQTGDTLLCRFAEADAGIEHDLIMADAGGPGDFERAREELRYFGDDVEGRISGLAIVHDNDRRAVLGNDSRHVRIALQTPDVVDDARPGFERPGRHDGFI